MYLCDIWVTSVWIHYLFFFTFDILEVFYLSAVCGHFSARAPLPLPRVNIYSIKRRGTSFPLVSFRHKAAGANVPTSNCPVMLFQRHTASSLTTFCLVNTNVGPGSLFSLRELVQQSNYIYIQVGSHHFSAGPTQLNLCA